MPVLRRSTRSKRLADKADEPVKRVSAIKKKPKTKAPKKTTKKISAKKREEDEVREHKQGFFTALLEISIVSQ